MKHLGIVFLTVEKSASELVPFQIVSSEVEGLNEDTEAHIREELGLVETQHIGLPEFDFQMEEGDRLSFKADFYGEYHKYWTDCGWEHDATFEFRNVADLSVWRAVFPLLSESGSEK